MPSQTAPARRRGRPTAGATAAAGAAASATAGAGRGAAAAQAAAAAASATFSLALSTLQAGDAVMRSPRRLWTAAFTIWATVSRSTRPASSLSGRSTVRMFLAPLEVQPGRSTRIWTGWATSIQIRSPRSGGAADGGPSAGLLALVVQRTSGSLPTRARTVSSILPRSPSGPVMMISMVRSWAGGGATGCSVAATNSTKKVASDEVMVMSWYPSDGRSGQR